MTWNKKEWAKRFDILIQRVGECRHGVPTEYRCIHCMSDAYSAGYSGAEGFGGITPEVNEWKTTRPRTMICKDGDFSYSSESPKNCNGKIHLPVGTYRNTSISCPKCGTVWSVNNIHSGFPDHVTDYDGTPYDNRRHKNLAKLRNKNHDRIHLHA